MKKDSKTVENGKCAYSSLKYLSVNLIFEYTKFNTLNKILEKTLNIFVESLNKSLKNSNVQIFNDAFIQNILIKLLISIATTSF